MVKRKKLMKYQCLVIFLIVKDNIKALEKILKKHHQKNLSKLKYNHFQNKLEE